MPAPINPQRTEPPAAETSFPPLTPPLQVRPESAQPPSPAAVAVPPPATGLDWTWTNADHPSGIYYAKSDAQFTLIIDNPTDHPLPIGGQILFGSHDPPAPSPTAATNPTADNFKTIAIIPVTSANLQPGQRAKIPLSVTFAAVGTYELRSIQDQTDTRVTNSTGTSLECIFAPRESAALPAARTEETPWITTLPQPAVLTPGYLTDFIRQTTIRRFLIDERFAFDPQARVGLGFGASLNAGSHEVDALLAEAFLAKAGIVLRVTVPTADNAPADRTLAGFQQYLRDAIHRSHGALKAVVIAPDAPGPLNSAQQAAFRAFYLAGYQTAKHEDKALLMLKRRYRPIHATTPPSTKSRRLHRRLRRHGRRRPTRATSPRRRCQSSPAVGASARAFRAHQPHPRSARCGPGRRRCRRAHFPHRPSTMA